MPFLVAYILMAVPALIGLRRSLRDRHLDHKHFASFVGFVAALGSLTAATFGIGMLMRLGVQSAYNASLRWHALAAIFGLSTTLGCVVAFVAGVFSTGRRRIFLIVVSAFILFTVFIAQLGRQGT